MATYTVKRDISKAFCIRLLHDIHLAGEWRGGMNGTAKAFYPLEELDLRVSKVGSTVIFGVEREGRLFEVEVPISALHSVVYAPVKPDEIK